MAKYTPNEKSIIISRVGVAAAARLGVFDAEPSTIGSTPILKNFRVALVGDSIVQNNSALNIGLRAHGFWSHVNSMLGGVWDFRLENNFGRGGDTSTMQLATYDSVVNSGCGLHIIAVGTNDRGSANMTAQQTIDNIKAMIKRSREEAGALVEVVCPRPRGSVGNTGSKNLSATQLTNHKIVRDWIMSINQAGVYPTDTWTTLVDPLTEGFIKTGFTIDDLHPNQLGAFNDAVPIAATLSKISPTRAILPVTNSSSGITVNPQLVLAASGGGNVAATGIYTLTGSTAAGQSITIGSITYTLATTALTSPAVAYEVVRSSTNSVLIGRLANAINGNQASGDAGKYYATDIQANPTVTAAVSATDPNTLIVTAKTAGTAGNSITTTATTPNGTWARPTLTGDAQGAGGVAFADSWLPSVPAGITVVPEIVNTATGRWYQITITGSAIATETAITLMSQNVVAANMLTGTEYEAVCEYEVNAGMMGLQGFQLGFTAKVGSTTRTLWDAEHLAESPSILPTYSKPRVKRTPPMNITGTVVSGSVQALAYTIPNQDISAVIRVRAVEGHPVPMF